MEILFLIVLKNSINLIVVVILVNPLCFLFLFYLIFYLYFFQFLFFFYKLIKKNKDRIFRCRFSGIIRFRELGFEAWRLFSSGYKQYFLSLTVFVMDTNSCAALNSENFCTAEFHSKALFINKSQYTCHPPKHASLDDIGQSIIESLHIEDAPIISPNTVLCQSFDINNLNLLDDVDYKDLEEIVTTKVNSEREFRKSATFPCSGKTPNTTISSHGEGEEDGKHTNGEFSETARPRSIYLPSPLKLVSAMKGTREKMGKPRDKASVTWAPDVYDPPPSAASTAVINNKPRRKNDRKKNIDSKKNGKNKQKKKSSKGSSSSSSKDRKPVQKYYRGSNVFYQSFEAELVNDGFDCGGTFLKKSVTSLHFSMAEAT